jgi:hypothetical protein
MPPPHGRGQRPLDRNPKFADRINGVIGQPGIELGLGLLPGKRFVPHHATLAFIGSFHCRIEHAYRRLPNVASRSVTLDKRHDRIIRHLVLSIGISDLFSVGRYRHTVIRTRHPQPPCEIPSSYKILCIIENTSARGRSLTSRPCVTAVTTASSQKTCARPP